MHQTSRSARLTVALGMAVAAMAGCSFSASLGGDSVDKDEVAAGAVDVLVSQSGIPWNPSESLTCIEDLKVDAGSIAMCEYRVASGAVYDVTVTSKGVDSNGKVGFRVVVSETPR